MASELPSYVAEAKPVPLSGRVPWYKSTAQTYAGIMLWFVFWQTVPASGLTSPGGILAYGLGTAILGVFIGGIICHFASYRAPAMMGMQTGLPLAVLGTSTYGVRGGFLMPGFFMGVLQFGWLAVNAFFSGKLLAGSTLYYVPSLATSITEANLQLTIGIIFAIAAALIGLKGIHYVAKVATYLPLIPLVILLILAFKAYPGIANFKPEMLAAADTMKNLPSSQTLLLFAVANIVGFFATAGAAGADIASSNRTKGDVQLGGLVGVAGSTILTGCLALLIVAGTYGLGKVTVTSGSGELDPTKLMGALVGEPTAKLFWLLLAIAAFPPACFSSLIAANSFRNTLSKVPPFISCGIGTAAAIALVVTGKAGDAAGLFTIIGASFGPICGAMTADYFLAGRKWPGPRAGFNLAGWLSWAVGFVVGTWNSLFAGWFAKLCPGNACCNFEMPCPPVAAIIVGFVLYIVLAMIGLQSRKLDMPR